MAQQQQQVTSSSDDQLTDMIGELYNTEMAMQQTGTFVPMITQPGSPMLLLGTRNTTISLPSSAVSSPSILNRGNRTAAAAAATVAPPRVRVRAHIPYRGDDDNDTDDQIVILQTNAQEIYQCRTLNAQNITRMTLLPIFPYKNMEIETVPTADNSTRESITVSAKPAHLLLCNVPLDSLGPDQYARLRRGMFPQLFRLEINSSRVGGGGGDTNITNSFLLSFYEDFYMKLKKRLKVDISLLDYNSIRLRQCVNHVVTHYRLEQTMLHMDELAIALEFYLQIDVDMFFLKTCSFNGVQPRLFEQRFREGLFCLYTPTARFSITPCEKSSCLCCHSTCPRRYVPPGPHEQMSPIQFSNPHIHRFVNQYEAILNCPATCESKNCIYVLTCPCGQFDFIGESKISFAETLAMHREEGNRIIREFLIGERNIEHTTHGLKSEKKKANDKLWLYQHSARCYAALQLFLDYNPEYWCFIPTKIVQRQLPPDTTVRGYLSAHSTSYRETSFDPQDFSTTWTRSDADVRLLVENVPKPPLGYDFNHYLRQQQANFFKWTQDRNVPLYNVDLYNADIIAILPDNASKLFRKLIESLLITHADCKLNQIGHLLRSSTSNMNPNRSLENTWCVNVTRCRPPSSSATTASSSSSSFPF